MLAEWNRAAGVGETVSVTRPPYMPDVVLIELAERFGTPLYVYNFDFVAEQVRHMRSPPALPPAPGCYPHLSAVLYRIAFGSRPELPRRHLCRSTACAALSRAPARRSRSATL